MMLAAESRCTILLGLAVAASLLELGPLVALLKDGDGLLALLLAGLAYQVGNAAPRPAILTGRIVLALLTLVAAGLLVLTPASSIAWLAAIALLSWALQAVRRAISADGPANQPTTVQKRTARVIGFIAAALLPLGGWLIGVVILIACAIPLLQASPEARAPQAQGFGHPLEWTMLVHQTHYFTYAYAVPFLAAQSTLGGTSLVGLWFACGWITYLSAESLWRRWAPRTVFIVGHLALALVLALMSTTSAMPWLTIAFWVLSGFGGGTVYCLTLLHKREGLAHERLERAEDAGHLLGVMLAILGVYFLNWNAITLPLIGSIWAIGAALAMMAMLVLNNGHNNSSARSNKPTGGANAGQ
jgi:hypothetical protein